MKVVDSLRLTKNIQSRLLDDLDANWVGGAVMLVNQFGKRVYECGFGEKKLGEDKAPDTHTMYRLASMTKPITAVAILMLQEHGLLTLHDRVENYLPAFGKVKVGEYNERGELIATHPLKTSIRISHLLTHTNGIGVLPEQTPMTDGDKENLQTAVAYHARQPLAFQPMTGQGYSATAAFDVAGQIVELVTGTTFAKFLEKELFAPLGMKNTTFAPTDNQWENMAYMHDCINGKSVEQTCMRRYVFADYPPTYFCGGAGLASTAEDYSRFAEMLLAGGTYQGIKILSKQSVEKMSSVQVPLEVMDEECNWGLGVRVISRESYGRLPVGTFGWSGAYGTHFWVDPVNQITAVYLKNSYYDGGAGAITAMNFEEDVANALVEE